MARYDITVSMLTQKKEIVRRVTDIKAPDVYSAKAMAVGCLLMQEHQTKDRYMKIGWVRVDEIA